MAPAYAQLPLVELAQDWIEPLLATDPWLAAWERPPEQPARRPSPTVQALGL